MSTWLRRRRPRRPAGLDRVVAELVEGDADLVGEQGGHDVGQRRREVGLRSEPVTGRRPPRRGRPGRRPPRWATGAVAGTAAGTADAASGRGPGGWAGRSPPQSASRSSAGSSGPTGASGAERSTGAGAVSATRSNTSSWSSSMCRTVTPATLRGPRPSRRHRGPGEVGDRRGRAHADLDDALHPEAPVGDGGEQHVGGLDPAHRRGELPGQQLHQQLAGQAAGAGRPGVPVGEQLATGPREPHRPPRPRRSRARGEKGTGWRLGRSAPPAATGRPRRAGPRRGGPELGHARGRAGSGRARRCRARAGTGPAPARRRRPGGARAPRARPPCRPRRTGLPRRLWLTISHSSPVSAATESTSASAAAASRPPRWGRTTPRR